MSVILCMALLMQAVPEPVVTGRATWFHAPDHTAAAGPALRKALGRGWRGTTVRVCHDGRCERLRLQDWCGCPNGRVIDLSHRVFRRFEPLWRGVMRVRVVLP